MAYLGAIGTSDRTHLMRLAWAKAIIAVDVIGDTIGQYAAHGGYIYVK